MGGHVAVALYRAAAAQPEDAFGPTASMRRRTGMLALFAARRLVVRRAAMFTIRLPLAARPRGGRFALASV